MNTNNKHTPGPWIIAPSSKKGNGTGWRDIHSTGAVFSPCYVGEALEQDAHLIAAAPELLEMLNHCLAAINDLRHCAMNGHIPTEELKDVVNRIERDSNKAIAKAKGK